MPDWTLCAAVLILFFICSAPAIGAVSEPGVSSALCPEGKMVYIANTPEQLEDMVVLLNPILTKGRHVWAVPAPGQSRTNATEFTILYSTNVDHLIEQGKSTMDQASAPVNSMMVIGIYGGALLLLIILYGSGRRFSAGYKANTGKLFIRICIAVYLVLAGLLLLSSFILTGSALEAYELTAFLLWIALFFQLYLGLSSLALVYSVSIKQAFPVIHLFHIVFAALALVVTHSLEYFSGGRIIPDLFVSAILVLSIIVAIIHYRTFQKIELEPVRKGHEYMHWENDQNDTFIGGEETTRTLNNTGFPVALEEKYGELCMIGRGGAARVYMGIRLSDRKRVAIKVPAHFDEKTGTSFLKEMRNWRNLTHQNIVKVYTANILPVPYVEMEYVSHSFDEWMRPSAVPDVLEVIRGVARGLLYAHEEGVVHLDIKPRNILIGDDGQPKITDWGLSRLTSDSNDTTMIAFSLNYASPEQVSPRTFGRPDARTDIYQLGVVMYEFLTGCQPFIGEGVGEVTSSIITFIPPLPSVSDSSLSPFDALIMKSLAKHPIDRYQAISDLICDLDAAIEVYIHTKRHLDTDDTNGQP